tara:strand:- start:1223 stop:1669 length:447 start_codon:yes stop_codon:yes gene_type:complete
MSSHFSKITIFLFLVSLLFFSCTPRQNIHGIMISQKDIENIVEGETNINFLITKYGEPTFTGAFNKNSYYQNETTRILPAGKKEIISRTILALEVNEDGIIIKKSILDLKDGIKVKKALGKTETAGSDFTFFQQIFSNLRSGRFASVE